jgi:hypothetical protein
MSMDSCMSLDISFADISQQVTKQSLANSNHWGEFCLEVLPFQ